MTKNKSGNIGTKITIAALVALVVGYWLLNVVATWEEEKRVLGAVFYIISGCILIAAGGITIGLQIRKKYFVKKRRKKSRPVFLEDQPRDKTTL